MECERGKYDIRIYARAHSLVGFMRTNIILVYAESKRKRWGRGGGEKDEGVRWTATDEARDATDVPITGTAITLGRHVAPTLAPGGVISLSRLRRPDKASGPHRGLGN